MKKGIAKIIRISNGDVVYIKDPTRAKITGFALGKITNYHGESAKELVKRGLAPGKEVSVVYDDIDRVQSVSFKIA